jgi:membrane protease YdiL (CAAX protease family)
MAKNVWVSLGIISFYLVFRLGFDSFWQQRSPYYAYAFEVVFVCVIGFLSKQQVKWQVVITDNLIPVAMSFAGGFAIYKLAPFSGIVIPFDLTVAETIFLLLILAPILEELIFRMALWEPMTAIFRKSSTIVIGTSILFSVGHLISLWAVPEQFRVFVLYQTLYVILLGLGAGWRRLATGSPTASILVHFGFNFGFFIASRV